MNTEARQPLAVEASTDIIALLRQLIAELDTSSSISLHRNIDQSFYMQKLSELVLIQSQVDAASVRLHELRTRLESVSAEVLTRFDHDVCKLLGCKRITFHFKFPSTGLIDVVLLRADSA